MSQDPSSSQPVPPALNLGLNDGTWMPQACVDLLRTYDNRTALRWYPSEDNRPLLDAIARYNGVTPEHIFLHHGSGPILRMVVPQIIKERIKASPFRMARHLLNKSGYPVVTPTFTYGKVPAKAAKLGLTVRLLPCGPETGFRVRASDVEAAFRKQDGFAYIASPNNPTGVVTVTRKEMEPVIAAFPESRFWIDEAYWDYLDPTTYPSFASLVPEHPNLMVSRTFSFAWGLASVHVGYLIADPQVVRTMRDQLTEYFISKLAEDLCVAALNDATHLPWLRDTTARARKTITDGMTRHANVEVFSSDSNFILSRFKDGKTGADLASRMRVHGIRIKTINPILDARFDAWFRVTVGVDEENERFVKAFDDVLAHW